MATHGQQEPGVVVTLEATSASRGRTYRVAVARVPSQTLMCPVPPSSCVCVCLSSRGSMTCTTTSPLSSTTWVTAFLWQPSWPLSCFSWPCGESTSAHCCFSVPLPPQQPFPAPRHSRLRSERPEASGQRGWGEVPGHQPVTGLQDAKGELRDPARATTGGNVATGADLPSHQAESLSTWPREPPSPLIPDPRQSPSANSCSRLTPDLGLPQEYPLPAERDSLESHHHLHPAKCHVVPAAAHRPPSA